MLVESDGDPTPALQEALAREGRATLLGRRVRPDKLEGISAERVDALRGLADVILVEADGARGRSLKVPAPPRAGDPVLRDRWSSSLRAGCAGQAAGRRQRAPGRARARATGVARGRLDAATMAARPAPSDELSLAHPAGARAGVFLNKAETDEKPRPGRAVAVKLRPWYGIVAAGLGAIWARELFA